jgi:glycine oxidase
VVTTHLSHSSPAELRVAIVGAGVIGLGIGWRLVAAGAMVDIYERGHAGRGASWAAAGMLAAAAEAEPSEERLLPLALESQRRWPAFAKELEAASGTPIGYRTEGTLVIALTRDDAEQLRISYEFQRGLGLDLEWLGPAAILEREPFLNPRLAGGCISPRDHQVDNRRLAAALAVAFRRAGGRLHEGAPVERIAVEAGRARGVVVAGEMRHADKVVVAAGPWSGLKELLPEEARPPVRPIKGQMLAVRMDTAAPLLRRVVWTPRVYLVPRGDGRLIVGGTVEERGFDEAVTAGGLFSLLEGAWRALPGIEECAIDETWVGFRPGSPDDAPILGPSRIAGLFLATGHHRNGILLTPVTSDAIAECILTGVVPDVIRDFGVDRFDTFDGDHP